MGEAINSPDFILLKLGLGLPGGLVFSFVALAIILSSFAKIATILSILIFGLGKAALPSAVITTTLGLALTYFAMYPTINAVSRAVDREIKGKTSLSNDELLRAMFVATTEWKAFLIRNIDAKDVDVYYKLATSVDKHPAAKDAIPAEAPPIKTPIESSMTPSATQKDDLRILIPAFFISELSKAFKTGITVLLPFVIVDLLVIILLSALGTVTFNTLLLSFPLKLILFTSVNGWELITTNILSAYL